MVIKKNYILSFILTLLLLAGLFFFIFTYDSNVKTLRPGGIVEFSSGIAISAPEGSLDTNLRVRAKPSPDAMDQNPFPSFMSELKLHGVVHEISASTELYADPHDFLILALPVEEGSDPKHLAVAVFVEDAIEDGNSNDDNGHWMLFRGAYDPASGMFGTLLTHIGKEPKLVALVESEDEDEPIFLVCITYELEPETAVSWDTNLFWVIATGFDEDTLPHTVVNITINKLMEAYVVWTDMGFKDPRLRPAVGEYYDHRTQSVELYDAYEYNLIHRDAVEGSSGRIPRGWYGHLVSAGYTVYSGDPDDPRVSTTRHELFHAIQFSYENFRNDYKGDDIEASWGFVEGTASLAQTSLFQLESDHSDRPVLNLVGDSLLTRYAFSLDEVWQRAAMIDYYTQDFWAYIGKSMNPDNPNLGFLIPFLERGATLSAIDSVLKEEGTFSSLGDAYWQFAKNHTFEKNITYGDAPSPGLPPMIRLPFKWSYEEDYTAQPAAYTEYYRLEPLSSVVVNCELPHVSGMVLNDLGIYEIEIKPSSPVAFVTDSEMLKYKFYPVLNPTTVHTEYEECEPFHRHVCNTRTGLKLLVSNIDWTEPIYFRIAFYLDYETWSDLYTDRVIFPEGSIIQVKSSLDDQRGGVLIESSIRRHGGTTPYDIYTHRAVTDIRLQAPLYVGKGHERMRFSHWLYIRPGEEEITGPSHPSLRILLRDGMHIIAKYARDGHRLSVEAATTDRVLRSSLIITSNTGHGGTADYSIDFVYDSTEVHLKAPEYIGEGVNRKRFTGWTGDIKSSEREISFIINRDMVVSPVYVDDPETVYYNLTVSSAGASHVNISSTSNHGGTTDYTVAGIASGSEVTLTAPETVGSGSDRKRFSHWSGGESSSSRSISFTMNKDTAVKAHYVDDPVITYTLFVCYEDDDVLEIEGTHGGTAPYKDNVEKGTVVVLIAPDDFDNKKFDHWKAYYTDGTTRTFNNAEITFPMERDVELWVYYY